MRDWQRDAPKMIRAIHDAMPDATPAELRKALRKEAQAFSFGTSWGGKVWSKHCRIYIARMTGGVTVGPETTWPADIAFPFRGLDNNHD